MGYQVGNIYVIAAVAVIGGGLFGMERLYVLMRLDNLY
jgi:hypothetical protein